MKYFSKKKKHQKNVFKEFVGHQKLRDIEAVSINKDHKEISYMLLNISLFYFIFFGRKLILLSFFAHFLFKLTQFLYKPDIFFG